jgi:chromate transport protein ChrA
VSDRAWSLALLTAILLGALALLLLIALGLELGRAVGAVLLFLAALLPCCVVVGATCATSRAAPPLWAQGCLAVALAAVVAAAVVSVRGPGGEEIVDTDRAGRILTR